MNSMFLVIYISPVWTIYIICPYSFPFSHNIFCSCWCVCVCLVVITFYVALGNVNVSSVLTNADVQAVGISD